MCQQHRQFRCPTHSVDWTKVPSYYINCVIFTCSGEVECSVCVEDEEQLSEYSSSMRGSNVRLGKRPRIVAPVIGGVINSSSIINSVLSSLSEDIEPSLGYIKKIKY